MARRDWAATAKLLREVCEHFRNHHRVKVEHLTLKHRRAHWDAGGFVTVTGDIGSYVGPEAMGIDWMTGQELSQAIPPVYSEYIGRQWREHFTPLWAKAVV